MNSRIPYGKQHVTEEDIQAVVEVLRSDFWTQGPRVPEFEKNFAQYVGAEYAVAVANGTAALHLCAMAMNVKPGDKVITSPITFVASANCIAYCGGEVIFADIERDTYLLDINAVRKLLEDDTEKKIKGIIPVDFAGRVVDMEAFKRLAEEFDCWIIEDACHAPGGSFLNSEGKSIKAGNGKYADLAIFSFHPVKHIAAGEGGMITTNNKELYERLLIIRTHGIQQQLEKRLFDDSLWYYEMQELGYNYRLTEIQAALGNSQLKRAEAGLKRRREIAQIYYEAFKDNPNIVDRNEGYSQEHAYHLYVIEVKDRKGLHSFLRKENIFAQIHYIPAHLMPYYRDQGWKEGDMPNSEDYYKFCISLPMYPGLQDESQKKVIEAILNNSIK
jgi:UDP-4-amino-4,6-dideoxy-N-acetyl-beta-L-altrosamine transaminase